MPRIRGVQKELKIPYEEQIKILCDNESAICIARDLMYRD